MAGFNNHEKFETLVRPELNKLANGTTQQQELLVDMLTEYIGRMDPKELPEMFHKVVVDLEWETVQTVLSDIKDGTDNIAMEITA